MKKLQKSKENSAKKSISSKDQSKPRVVNLPRVMDITCAVSLLETLRQETAAQDHLTLNGQAVARITTPGVQLLLSTARMLEGRGGWLKLRSPSPALTEAMADLGFTDKMRAWSV